MKLLACHVFPNKVLNNFVNHIALVSFAELFKLKFVNLPGYDTLTSQSPQGIILGESISPGYHTRRVNLPRVSYPAGQSPQGIIPSEFDLPGV